MAHISEYYENVVGVGAHYYWVKFDDDGNMKGQIHGFAVAGPNSAPETTQITGMLMATSRYSLDINKAAGHQLAYQASNEEINKLWEIGVKCSDSIGTGNYQYNMFNSFGGKNSNAVFSTVGECMKLPMTDITSPLTAVPGFGDTTLVAKAVMDLIYNAVMDSAPNPENPGGGGGGEGPGGGGTGGGTGGGSGGGE